MSVRSHFKAGLALVLGSALIIAACSETGMRTSSNPIAPSGAGGSYVLGQLDLNQLEICKVYSGIVGPPVVFNYTVDVARDGDIDITSSVTLAHNQCAEIHTTQSLGSDRVDITEVTPSGYTVTWAKTQQTGASIVNTTGSGPTAFGTTTHIDGGAIITFTNTSIPTVAGTGRFTGGSWTEIASGLRISNGLTIHCDLLLSNNLEINWKDANDVQHQFHMTEHLTTVACTDSASIPQPPPAAPLDTLIGTGTGKFDGTPGYTVEFTFVDSGEPGGSEDRIALRIFLGSTVVLNVPLQDITKGNLQAHFDQPHR